MAALKYGDLSNLATKDYVFDLDRFSSFEGNTGPYILYTIVRIKSILEKYKDWNPENPEGPCFPIPSNQKMNEFLKEIATLCRVNKRLTVHVARHTFATTVTLANDVALQNVSKMLGHSSTRMTQHYARVLDNSIMKDMQDVSRVFG